MNYMEAAMLFTIEYFREGRLLASQPWKANALDVAANHARRQMLIHSADFARIIDAGGSDAEVWSERRNARPSAEQRPGDPRADRTDCQE